MAFSTNPINAPLLQPGDNAVQMGELQTSDAQLKRMAYGGFKVLVAT
jgi:hypothetical protein